MEATSGVGGTAGVTGAGDLDRATLTPEALMTYCATRLRDIDTEVNAKFDAQAKTGAYTTALSALQEELNSVVKRTGGGNNGENVAIKPDDVVLRAAIDKKFEDAIAAAPPWAKQGIQAAFDDWKKKVGDDGYWLKEVQAKADNIGDLAKQASSSAELDMIKLQSLMSQRQTCVQLITNMLGSLNDSLKAIAMKVGA